MDMFTRAASFVLMAIVVLSCAPVEAQSCWELRQLRQHARRHGMDGAALADLERRLCFGRGNIVVSPSCEELRTMELLVQLEPAKQEALNPLKAKHRREVSQLRRVVCGGNALVNSTTWSTGRLVVVTQGSLNYPNGKKARDKEREWLYPSGKRARTAAGRWYYPGRDIAATPDGDWLEQSGAKIDNPAALRRRACRLLGPDLCTGTRGVDPDLISAAMIYVLSE